MSTTPVISEHRHAYSLTYLWLHSHFNSWAVMNPMAQCLKYAIGKSVTSVLYLLLSWTRLTIPHMYMWTGCWFRHLFIDYYHLLFTDHFHPLLLHWPLSLYLWPAIVSLSLIGFLSALTVIFFKWVSYHYCKIFQIHYFESLGSSTSSGCSQWLRNGMCLTGKPSFISNILPRALCN